MRNVGKILIATSAVAALWAGALSTPANALPFINGSITFTDGILNLPTTPTSTIVSQLTTVQMGTPAVFGCTGDMSGCTVPTTAGTFDIPISGSSVLFTVTGSGGDVFTYTLNTETDLTRGTFTCSGGLCNDSLVWKGFGTVTNSLNLFAPTIFNVVNTLTGSCGTTGGTECDNPNNFTGGYSASVSSLGTDTIPEPASLGLFGMGLLGIGAIVRRRRRA